MLELQLPFSRQLLVAQQLADTLFVQRLADKLLVQRLVVELSAQAQLAGRLSAQLVSKFSVQRLEPAISITPQHIFEVPKHIFLKLERNAAILARFFLVRQPLGEQPVVGTSFLQKKNLPQKTQLVPPLPSTKQEEAAIKVCRTERFPLLRTVVILLQVLNSWGSGFGRKGIAGLLIARLAADAIRPVLVRGRLAIGAEMGVER